MAAVRVARAGPSRDKETNNPSTRDLTKGSIVRIKLENFLTYDSVEFRPGPKLNVIIGPNGTGKSTIVCGICLGLAGKTSTIGRATHVSEYVKHGCSKANIEIELLNPGKDNYVICREIRRDGGSSWFVNKKPSSQKVVEDLMLQLNIQVGNLCQFLPQDRVADFVKMTQIELLENTEKAVGSTEMFDQHSKLKVLRNCVRDLDTGFKNNAERLEKEKQKNERLEVEVRNFQQRQHHLDRIELLKKKKPWLEYEEARKCFNELKETSTSISKALEELKTRFAPVQQKIDLCKKKVAGIEIQMKDVNNYIRDANMILLKKQKTMELHSNEILEAQEELKGKNSIKLQHRQRSQDLRQQLESLRSELASVDDSNDVQPLIDQKAQEIQQLCRRLVQIQNEQETTRSEKFNIQNEIKVSENQLQQLQDVNRRRMEMLRRRNQNAYSAVQWLRTNKDKFKKTIHEPIATLINVIEPRFAMYVEAHIAFRDLFAFVCEDGGDMDLFLKEIRDNQKLRVNAVLAPDATLDSFKPRRPLDHLRRWGFHHYLKDMFVAPESVMCYLCRQYGIHSVPVGDESTRDNIEKVLQESGERFFYTAKHSYSVKQSKYSRNFSTKNEEIGNPSLLTETLDVEKQRELQKNIQRCQSELAAKDQTCVTLKQEENAMTKRLEQLKEEKKSLSAKRDLKKNLMARINQKELSIQHCEQSVINLEEEKIKFKGIIQTRISEKCKVMKDIVKKSRELLDLNKCRINFAATQADAMSELKTEEEKDHRSKTLIAEKEQERQRAKDEMHRLRDRAKELLIVAKRVTNLKPSEELPAELKDMFSNMPDSVDELEAEIHNVQALADCLLQTDERIVFEFTKRVKDIANMEKMVQSNKQVIEQKTQQMESLKQQWLPALENLIQRINQNFSKFFSMLGCAGEVGLNKSDVEDDFDKYGICIKVKFRDGEQLKELTPYHQSGGERSVATVLYMLALQELTHVPFRCVDEINQGMDSTNERKVFELMVQTSCRENTAQYFLLTPKLLPDLQFNSSMTVLCVYNGKETLNHTQWNLKKFIRRRKSIPD